MPRVSKEYIVNKKKMIVEAAYKLCIKKTVSTVTMQDIINETKLSQGGIYRFYKDIDEIFADMFLFLREEKSIKGKIDEIFEDNQDKTAIQLVDSLLQMLADFMEQELMGVEKLDFELAVLAMNEPNRVKSILKNVPGESNMQYLTMRVKNFLDRQIEDNRLSMRVSVPELLAFVSASYTGIQTECIVQNCYQNQENPLAALYQPKVQFSILSKTISFLMGESGQEIKD